MQQLNQKEFKGISDRVIQELGRKQQQMRNMPIPQTIRDEEKELKNELNKWSMIEESIYKQKSRVQWLKLGDTNTKYFFCSDEGKEGTKSDHNAEKRG